MLYFVRGSVRSLTVYVLLGLCIILHLSTFNVHLPFYYWVNNELIVPEPFVTHGGSVWLISLQKEKKKAHFQLWSTLLADLA